MARKERRAKARRTKIKDLRRPVKASRTALIVLAIIAAIAVIATQAIKLGGS
ncbi:MAG: hypothetical protein LBU89_12300 [Fibromonadaceae bacterium]|nr:hypothetical protein [Fibromonadaceae bacterium]